MMTTTMRRSSTAAAKVLFRAVVVFLLALRASAAIADQKEAYFNGSAYLRLVTPMPIWSHSAISFRTCRGGEILTQRHNGHILLLSVTSDALSLSLTAPHTRVEARVQSRLLDNRWHDVHLLYEQGTLQLIVDKQSVVVANATYNTQFLIDQDIKNEASVLILGSNYYGCLLHGPGLIFNANNMHAHSVIFGACPLSPGACGDHDVLIRPSANYCLHDPCMQHGSCVSRQDSYVCHCTARYTGKNCEIDSGPPCHSHPCANDGLCVEDSRGDYKCLCGPGFSGPTCEQQVYVHPLCEASPCKNNGTCKGVPGTNVIECECGKGFTGSRCEIDRDECESQPCENGGKCTDGIGTFQCDCSDTGYTGTLCQNNIDECQVLSPCQNGATCYDTYGSFTCECAPGFGGYNCAKAINECLSQPCLHGGTCNDRRGHFECSCVPGFSGLYCENTPHDLVSERAMGNNGAVSEPEKRVDVVGGAAAAERSACSSDPCENGGSCYGKGSADYTCVCVAGFNGTNCEHNIDDCKGNEKACQFGICVDQVNGFVCYCKPGYTGTYCERDLDECLSMPCKNNAVCVNQVNDFACTCPAGFTGKDCGIDINECASNPCSAGSTCIDEVAKFKCVCVPGITGQLCETNIDDCESQPCFNSGKCIDGLNEFACDCTGTGFSGEVCEVNIDECLSQPCVNGAQCVDEVNDYRCQCYAGYSGKNCEVDIDECEKNPCQYNGTCLQRSNMTLYDLADNYKYGLPKFYSSAFSYENASGFVCLCVDGITGEHCEININECDSNPCSKFGSCVDQVGGYLCECEPGFTGTHCETNIDECELYTPCLHGTCIDGRDNYDCDCDPAWGGKNCSMLLIGCNGTPCQNSGTCIPYLVNENDHKFNCSCDHGFQGLTCEKVTTISLHTTSLITVNTTRDEGYDIQLRFKTTLPNGILAFGTGTFGTSARYILGLVNGRLNLNSPLLNKWEGVFIGSHLNDSKWQKVFVAINASHLVLSANDEQTIYPISSYEGTNGSNSTFPVTNLGGTIPNLNSYLKHLTRTPSSFVGCMEDVVINGQWVFPLETNNNYITLHDVPQGCPRTPQCDPNPCNSNGECTDLWHTFSCTCQRPFLGKTCKFEITAATFGNENTISAPVTVDVYDQSKRAVRSVLDISMFIRTRQATGQIFYLGSENRTNTGRDWGDSFVSAKLVAGELYVQMQFNGSPEAYTVGGNKLDNGYTHLIQIIRNLTLIQVKLNGTEYFRKTISSTGLLDAQVLYLGGPPPSANGSGGDLDHFKGIIQDVKVSNGSQLMIIELYPLNELELDLPPSFGDVDIQPNSTLPGEVSDDLCRNEPCLHGATCRNTWNDFVCICPRGYKGKYCQDIQFCEIHKCPGQGVCQNLDDGFECLTNTTFQGDENRPLMFSYVAMPNEQREAKKVATLEVTYRAKTGGTLLYVQNEQMYFEVASYKDQVTVQWRLNSELPEAKRFIKEDSDFEWNTIYVRVSDNTIDAGWRGWEATPDGQPLITTPIDQKAFMRLFSGRFPVYLGGVPPLDANAILLAGAAAMERDVVGDNYRYENNVMSQGGAAGTTSSAATSKGINEGAVFKGCLGEVRIDGFLLPYFPHKEIYNETALKRSHYVLNTTKPEEGCVLCFQNNCQNGGYCSEPTEKYPCDCLPGYEDDDCSVNINECLQAECTNNSTCIDGIASYTCQCLAGFEGQFCQTEIDECESQPCQNGGQCTDLVARYSCACTEEYAGEQCEVLRLVTCENHPCHNGSTCNDGYNADTKNNFTCTCSEGYQGVTCSTAFCNVEKCQNNGFCLTTEPTPPLCQCSLGYTGKYCESEIDECAAKPCEHGQCIDLIGDYRCNCSGTGFEGVNCENDIDECVVGRIMCGGRGACVNTRGSFKCRCEPGKCGMDCNLADPCLMENVCLNGGVCIESCTTEAAFECNCTDGFAGTNCSEVALLADTGASPTDIALIVVPIVVGLLLLGAIALGVFLTMARNKRATRGTYSPSAQEYCNPRLEMDNVLKPPPEERLI